MNVSTHSLGVVGEQGLTGDKKVSVVIPKGTPLPAKATREFATLDMGQNSINVAIVEGDHTRPQDCVPIGRVVIDDLPPGLADHWPIAVTCEYGSDGRLKVDVHVRYTDRSVDLKVVRLGGLTSTHVKRWHDVVAAGRGLSGIREVLAKGAAEGRDAPIALATTHVDANDGPENAILGFLRRLARFAFRKSHASNPDSSSSDAEKMAVP